MLPFVPSRQETEELISSIPLEAGKLLNHLTGYDNSSIIF